MASTDSYTFDHGGLFVYFNVSHAVGDNAANYWTDIMLVQYLIRSVYLLNNNGGRVWTLSPTSQNDIGDIPDPHRDFKALRKTAKWIRYFQIDATLHNSCPMVANGRILPITNATADHRRSPPPPITVLNTAYQDTLGLLRFDWKKFALEDPGMPPVLKTQLKRNLLETVEVG